MTLATDRPSRPPKRTFATLKKRLGEAGFKSAFVRSALLPDWWDKDCQKDSLSDIEFVVARFLQLPIELVRDPSARLQTPPQVSGRLRSPANTNTRSLVPAVHAANMIAAAVVRNLRPDVPAYTPLLSDSLLFREKLGIPGFKGLLHSLWSHGVPVITVKELPSPKFRALACWAIDRPVIIIGKQDKAEPDTLINLAHEAGHVASGHISPVQAIVEGDVDDRESPLEKEAWDYGNSLLAGHWYFDKLEDFPLGVTDAVPIKEAAERLSRERGVDPALLVHWWAKGHGQPAHWGTKKYLLKVWNRSEDAQAYIRACTRSALGSEKVSETDETLLRACLV